MRSVCARVFRLGTPLVIITALALLVIAVADVQVARGRDAVELDLATARTARARIPQRLMPVDPDALAIELDTLIRSSAAAQQRSSGFFWLVAGRTVRGEVRRGRALAAAAVPLLRSLMPDPGESPLDRLDDFARQLATYTSAALRVGDPSGPLLERAASAAGLLPGLAGAEGPRTWTICRTTSGPCVRTVLSAGRLGPITGTRTGPTPADARDLLIVGATPALTPASGIPMMFDLLCTLGPGSADGSGGSTGTQVTIHSVVGTEQEAIEQLRLGTG